MPRAAWDHRPFSPPSQVAHEDFLVSSPDRVSLCPAFSKNFANKVLTDLLGW
jgi:hypothetical protein